MKDETQDTDKQLRIMTRMLALNLMAGKKQREQIRLLATAGLDRNEIAALIGTTPGTVSVELSVAKKGSAKTRAK